MDPDTNFTKVNNAILAAMPVMSESELRVTLAIIRITIGYQKLAEYASLARLHDLTGMSIQGVLNGIKAMLDRGFIKRSDAGAVSLWIVNNGTEAPNQSTKLTTQPSGLLNEVERVLNEVETPTQLSRPGVLNEVEMIKESSKETLKENNSKESGANAPAAENAPPAPAPAAPENPEPVKKSRKQPDKAPQLHVFRAVMGRWPRRETEDLVIAAVGDRTAEQIQPYLAIWSACKYPPWNLAWLTEWSITGVPARIAVPEIYRDRVKVNAAGPPAISNPKIHPGWAAADKLAAQIREDEKNGYPGGRPVSLEDIFGTVPKLREGKQPGAP